MSDYLKFRQGLKNGTITKPEKPKPEPIGKRSAKGKQEDKEYKKLKDEMLAESNVCEMKTPVCTGHATGLQHKKRRGKYLLDKKYLLRSCDPCNLFVETHVKYALENGLAVKVHVKESKNE